MNVDVQASKKRPIQESLNLNKRSKLINIIPNELLFEVFSFSFDDLLNISLSCKKWKNISDRVNIKKILFTILKGHEVPFIINYSFCQSVDCESFLKKLLKSNRKLSIDNALKSRTIQESKYIEDPLVNLVIKTMRSSSFHSRYISTINGNNKLNHFIAKREEILDMLENMEDKYVIHIATLFAENFVYDRDFFYHIGKDQKKLIQESLNKVIYWDKKNNLTNKQQQDAILLDIYLSDPKEGDPLEGLRLNDFFLKWTEEWSNQKDYILKIIENSLVFPDMIPEKWWDDHDVVLKLFKSVSSYHYAQEEVCNYFGRLSKKLKNDPGFMREAIQYVPKVLQFGSQEIKNNADIVLRALKIVCDVFEYVPDLHEDQNLILSGLLSDASLMHLLSDELKNDYAFFLKALQKNNTSIWFFDNFWGVVEDKKSMIPMINAFGFDPSEICDQCSYLIHDPEYMLALVRQNGGYIKYAAPALKKDITIVLTACIQNPLEFSLYLKNYTPVNSDEHPNEGVNFNNLVYKSISIEDRVELDEKLMSMVRVLINPEEFKIASECIRNDEKVALEIVRSDGNLLEYATKEIKNNKKVVLAAVINNPKALQFASDELKKDLEVLQAIEISLMQECISTAMDSLINNRYLWFTVVQKNGLSLQYAPESFKRDVDLVRLAIIQNPKAFDYLDKVMKEDGRVLRIMELFDPENNLDNWLPFCHELKSDQPPLEESLIQKEVLNNLQLYISLLRRDARFGQYAAHRYAAESEVLCKFLAHSGLMLEYLHAKYINNKDMVLIAVKQNGLALKYVSEELRNDQDVVLSAILQNPSSFWYASLKLRNDDQFVLKAVKQNGLILEYVSDLFKENLGYI